MPNSRVSWTLPWHCPHVERAMFCDATDDDGSMCALMRWMPWQSVHTGALSLPRAMALPWIDVMKTVATFPWHLPHVAGILNLKIVDFGSFARRTSCALWQSTQ